MKKLLALFAAIAMTMSMVVVPVTAIGPTETAHDAYALINSWDYKAKSGADIRDKSETGGKYNQSGNSNEFGVCFSGSNNNTSYVTYNIDFGTGKTPVGMSIDCGWSVGHSNVMQVVVDGKVIAEITPYNFGSMVWNNYKTRYVKLQNTEGLTGVKEVKMQWKNTAGKWTYWSAFGKFKFYEANEDVSGIAPVWADAYADFAPYGQTRGVKVYDVDFGKGLPAMALQISRTYANNSAASALTVKIGDKVVSTVPAGTAVAETPLLQTAEVFDSSLCVGNKTITVEGLDSPTDISMNFVEIVDPYENLMGEDEVINNETMLEISKPISFSINGSKSLEVTYSATIDSTLAMIVGADSTADEGDEIVLPASEGVTTATIDLNNPAVFAETQGYLAMAVMEDGDAEITQVKFIENKINDQFAGATSVQAEYVGTSADWYTELNDEFEGTNAYTDRTFADPVVVDLSTGTDVEKMNKIKDYSTTADIVFVQDSEYAVEILDKIETITENAPYVFVVGEADYAADYGVSSILVGTGALANSDNYKRMSIDTPTYVSDNLLLDYYNAGSLKYKDDSTSMWKENKVAFGGSNNNWVKLPKVNFSHGVSSVTMAKSVYITNPETTSCVEMRLGDAYNGALLATFTTKNLETVNTNFSVEGEYDVYIVLKNADKGFYYCDVTGLKFAPSNEEPANPLYTNLYDLKNKAEYKNTSWKDADGGKVSMGGTNGNYIKLPKINFKEGLSAVAMCAKLYIHGATLQVRLDSADGEVLCETSVYDTNKNINYLAWGAGSELLTVEKSISGVHDIYVVLNKPANATGGLGYIDLISIMFIPSTEAVSSTITYSGEITADMADDNELVIVDGYTYLENNDSITWSGIDFGTESYKRLVANIAAADGELVISSGEDELGTIDLSDATGNFANISTTLSTSLSGADNTLTFTYTGSGCYFDSFKFQDLFALTSVLNNTNYDAVRGPIIDEEDPTKYEHLGVKVTATKFGSMIDNWIKWGSVNFGDTPKRLEAEFGYAVNAVYSGATIELWIDVELNERQEIVGGKKIADTIGEAIHWDMNTRVSKTELVNQYITGEHDVYVYVNNSDENGYKNNVNSTADIFDIQFREFTTNEEYYITSEEVTRSFYGLNANGEYKYCQKANHSREVTLSFVSNENSPESYMLITALYDTDGKLVKTVSSGVKTTVEGLNAATVRLIYRETDNDDATYTFKYFLWDGATLAPIVANGLETIDVDPASYPL